MYLAFTSENDVDDDEVTRQAGVAVKVRGSV